MKKQKNKKTELERRLEEEMKHEAGQPNPGGEPDNPGHTGETLPLGENHDVTEELSEVVEADLETLEAELTQYKDQLLRAHADFDNYRKRTARDYERLRRTAAEQLIRDLLPVLDNLELALHHKDDTSGGLMEGVEMVLKQFASALERHGVKPIPAIGEPFDPRVHEAVAHIDSSGVEPDKVAQEFQRGYTLGDLVLRPSKVAVSKGASGTSKAHNENA